MAEPGARIAAVSGVPAMGIDDNGMARHLKTGPDGGLEPSAAQNPILDHAEGVKESVTTTQVLITPPAGCQWIRVTSDVDIVLNTEDANAVDDGTGYHVIGGLPDIVPVTAGVDVHVLSLTGTATVRAIPYKARA